MHALKLIGSSILKIPIPVVAYRCKAVTARTISKERSSSEPLGRRFSPFVFKRRFFHFPWEDIRQLRGRRLDYEDIFACRSLIKKG